MRVGSTVRKPWTDATPSVLDFMTAIRGAGVDVPAALGRDEQGRQATQDVPGRLASIQRRSRVQSSAESEWWLGLIDD